jgi:iron complex transport system permease protein
MVTMLILSIILGLSFGSVDIPMEAVIRIVLSRIPGLDLIESSYSPGWKTIVLDLRLPVVVMALFVGGALSTSGASLQGLFKNPLVDPFIIGISAGGAFGWIVALVLTMDTEGAWVFWFRSSLSFIGAMATVTTAYLVARTGTRIPLANLLLAGVAISASLTAATQFGIYYFIENPRPVMISLLGTCSNSSWEEIAVVGPVVIISIMVLFIMSRDLNAFSMGEDDARGLGVNVERSKFLILGTASLIAAITVPFCGMIGFVGLMVPHMVRKFTGPDHRWLIPGSALFGACFLILCDLFSRTVMDQIIPLGIVTGLLGGGFFLYLMMAGRKTG